MKEEGLLFSELLEINKDKYIVFENKFDKRIRYTEDEINILTSEKFIGSRNKVLKNKQSLKDYIDFCSNGAKLQEEKRMQCLKRCSVLAKEKGFGDKYFDLIVYELSTLKEIENYLLTI